ncbi:MAG: cytochrome c3 family protein [Gemmatimonadota bacterium]|nr:MAG: cytochrome c3 family protein [Gemmatimonadota bacterium]
MQGTAAKRGGFVRVWWGYVGLGLMLTAGIVIAAVLTATPTVPQPVAFNHRKHTEELGLNCEFCHVYVTKRAHAGLPNAQTCTMCHQATQGTSAEAARVTTLLAEGDPLTFNKLFRLESHVFYTHRRHVGIAELECATCHGAIAATERPPARPLVRIDMDFCMDCHREQGQTLDCNACHR